MDYDTIICAVIALLVLARLWFVLGQRGEDRERPNPFAAPPDMNLQPQTAQPPSPIPLAPASLAGGLAQIQSADPGFDEKAFLQTARETFTAILGDFAKGDLSGSAKFLGPGVLPHFQNAIDARRRAGQTLELRLVAIREAECTAARFENGKAFVTVRFDSEQETALRDAQGNIVGGSSGKSEEIADIWTFARDVSSADPQWVLVETRS